MDSTDLDSVPFQIANQTNLLKILTISEKQLANI